ncbi:hypothetical protein SOVF_100890, partial [Spinacia oleracea]
MAVRVLNKRRKISRKSVQQLPAEILVQIASKLPVTSILQCFQRNKDGFNNIISDPLFPLLFHNDYTSSQNTSIFAYDACTNTSTLIDYDHYNHHLTEFRINDFDYVYRLEKNTSRTILSNCNVVGNSCNGWLLVCLLLNYQNSVSASLRLVNPITRSCVLLPEAPYALAWQDPKYGFGYASKTGLLKVVKLYHQPHTAKITTQVLTVCDEDNNNSTWEVMDTECSVELSSIQSEAVALNGALHWLVADNNLILRFDLDEEKFKFIPSPYTIKTCDENSNKTVSYLGVLNGLLCVGTACGSTIDKGMEIWVMKDYGIDKSWTCFTLIDYFDINTERFLLIPDLKNGK